MHLRRHPAQLRLEDLPHRRHRHFGDDVHPLRRGAPFRRIGPGEAGQFLFIRIRPRLELHIGDRYLPGIGIGPSDGRGQRHRGMGMQAVLDHAGVDVMSAPDDQVFGPARQPEIPVLVAAGQIAGQQPAILREQPLVMAFLLVTADHIRPLDGDNADFLIGAILGPAPLLVDTHGLHVLIGKADTDGADAPLAVRRVEG